MSKPIYTLWIEEETTENLENIRVQVDYCLDIKLKVAGNAREAWDFLQWEEFDVIIVDIRIPPGMDTYWEDLAMQDEKLGVRLVEKIFAPNSKVLKANKNINKYGVLTIEREKDIESIFKSKKGPLRNDNYKNKDHILDGDDLINFIRSIFFKPKITSKWNKD